MLNFNISVQLRLASPKYIIPIAIPLKNGSLIVALQSSTFHLHIMLPWWLFKTAKRWRKKREKINQKNLSARHFNIRFKSHRLQFKMEVPFWTKNERKVMRKYSLKLLIYKATPDCICPIAPPNAPIGYCWKFMEIKARDLTTAVILITA